MSKDRAVICQIISDMLDRPKDGIYPTGTCFTRLEHYIAQVRTQAVGWAHAHACVTLDRGDDPRCVEIPRILEAANKDLNEEEPAPLPDPLTNIANLLKTVI